VAWRDCKIDQLFAVKRIAGRQRINSWLASRLRFCFLLAVGHSPPILLGQLSDFDNLTRLNRLERRQHFREMRFDIIDIIRGSADDQNRDPAIRHVLLVLEILVYSD